MRFRSSPVDLPPGVHSDLKLLGDFGQDLQRPECVLVEEGRGLIVSDARGGVTRITAKGSVLHYPCPGGVTNGIALDRDGALLLAGIDSGSVHRLSPDGSAELLLDSFEGEKLGAVNFVHFDPGGSLWVTISTRVTPRSLAIAEPIPDGYVLKLTPQGPRLMASGFCFTNEIRFDPGMQYAYLAESRLGRVVRMSVNPDGGLGPPEPFGPAPLFEGAVVDGLAFDVEGGLWVTEVSRNGIYRIGADGTLTCLFEDPEGKVINFPASLAFGGDARKTLFVGSIRMDRVVVFQSPVSGARLWHDTVNVDAN